MLWSLRITVAATASYVVGLLFFPGTLPLLAPLTAMLVVQVTPVSLLASGLDRVIAVVSGVSLAIAFSAVVPLHWWSLGILIFVSITIGQALRLRSNLVEVAISGMLVLGVGTLGAEAAAWQRIAETLVGAVVGIAANLLFPPKVASADAGQAIDELADAVSDLLTRAADELQDIVDHGRDVSAGAREWLDDARRITHEDVPRVGAALLRAEQGRRFNVRAVGTADVGPGLRQGLEALEHSTVALRGMFRAVVDATDDAPWLADETAPDVLLGLAQTFRDLAAGVDAFGRLVRDEGDPGERLELAARSRTSAPRWTGCTTPAPASTSSSWPPTRTSSSSCTPPCSPPSSGCCRRWTSTNGYAARCGTSGASVRPGPGPCRSCPPSRARKPRRSCSPGRSRGPSARRSRRSGTARCR